MPLSVGSAAPDFTLPTDSEGTVTLSALKGGPVVIYFYPKDDTPGCTTEAKDFTDLSEEFENLGATVIGISKDSVKKHDKFKAKHSLSIVLASDEEGDVCERFDAWGLKKLYGREYEGIIRSTVLVDSNGDVAKIWPKVKVKGHAQDVLEAAKAL